MAFPQGIYFRSTDNQSDPTNYDAEVSVAENYPRVSAQGNNVGYEDNFFGGVGKVDRDVGSVVELKGFHQVSNSGGGSAIYRIDLPAPGTYNIRLALGEETSSQGPNRVRLLDNATQFAEIDASTSAAAKFIDATGIERTSQADWLSNNAPLQRVFASTIFRVKLGEGGGGGGGSSCMAALYIESAGGTPVLDEDGEWIITTQSW